MYCAFKNDVFTSGETKEELVNSLLSFWFDENTGALTVKMNNRFDTQTFHSYNMSEYTEEERYKDAIQFLFSKLNSTYGYDLYKKM